MVHRLFRIKESLAKLHKDLGHILENFLKNSQVVFEAHVAPQFYFYFLLMSFNLKFHDQQSPSSRWKIKLKLR